MCSWGARDSNADVSGFSFRQLLESRAHRREGGRDSSILVKLKYENHPHPVLLRQVC